ncbi:hypothetical protein NDU88_008705 [Pleurodeles waltl]|uniref:Uncharacterized protein n=1 Tax=Pleurodeles waltl TaxID=8319 RepID=A0AAV7RWV9_PLEWA|nr:hypothetical protein NDU88_008705 [Pleurodeles waltl]
MGSVQWNEPSGECGMREGWQLWREVGAGGTGEGAVIRIYLRIKDLLYIDDSDLSVATRVPEDVIEAYNQLLLPYAISLRFLSQWIPSATLCRRRKYGRSSGTHLPKNKSEGVDDEVVVCLVNEQLDGALDEQEWRNACEKDQDIKSIMQGVVVGWSQWDSEEDLSNKYKHVFDELSVINGLLFSYRFVNFVVKGKDVLGRVDGSCRCHGFRAMEQAIGGMWNAGGLAVVERGWCGRNG